MVFPEAVDGKRTGAACRETLAACHVHDANASHNHGIRGRGINRDPCVTAVAQRERQYPEPDLGITTGSCRTKSVVWS